MKLDKYPIMEINKQLIINIFKQENDVAATAKNIVDVIAIQQANRYRQGYGHRQFTDIEPNY